MAAFSNKKMEVQQESVFYYHLVDRQCQTLTGSEVPPISSGPLAPRVAVSDTSDTLMATIIQGYAKLCL